MATHPFSIPLQNPTTTDIPKLLNSPQTSSFVPVRGVSSTFEEPYVLGGVVFNESTGIVQGCVFNPDTDEWVVECEYETQNPELVTAHQQTDWELIHGDEDELAHGIFFFGEDAEIGRKAENTVYSQLTKLYTDGFVPPFGTTHKDDESVSSISPNECKHFQQIAPFDIGEITVEITLCQRCQEFHAIKYNNEWQSRDTTYNANWFMDDFNAQRSSITNIDDTRYVLHSSPASPGYGSVDQLSRMDMTGLLLTHNTSLGTINQIGMYIPSAHHLHVLIVNDEAIGVLLATPGGHDPQILVLGIREEFRGKGHATTLVQTWIDHLQIENRYELYDPNEEGLAVFKRLGHYNPTPKTREGHIDAVLTLELQRMDLSVDQFLSAQNTPK